MIRPILAFLWLAVLLPVAAVGCRISSFKATERLLKRAVRRTPALSEKASEVCVRRLRRLPASCLTWSAVASAYLERCGNRNMIAFSAARSGKTLSAHAFLKFPDGTTIGENGELRELS